MPLFKWRVTFILTPLKHVTITGCLRPFSDIQTSYGGGDYNLEK